MWPLFSPRPIATGTALVIGQSQTSACDVRRRAAGTFTVTLPSATVSVTGSDSGAASAPRLRDRVLDRGLVAAERMHGAVDDDLRRVDLAVAARARHRRAAGRNGRAGPACPSSRDSPNSRPAGSARRAMDRARQLAEQLVGGRTGRAALAGEQFDHRARLGRRRRDERTDAMQMSSEPRRSMWR